MSSPELGFLRFEVCGQTFAMSMASLAGIRQMTETRAVEAQSAPTGDPSMRVAPVDLAALFFDRASPSDNDFILIVRTETEMCALRVDRVLASTETRPEDRSALPPIIAALGGPFTGMFLDPDGWVLMIDANRLVDVIRQRYAGGVGELIYDIR